MDPEAVYVCADLPDDAGAVCALRLREIVNGSEFDETYTMEAEPNAYGLYRFVLERKDPDGHLDPDFMAHVTVTFYDTGGREIHTYEKTLWNPQREE